MGGVVKKWIGGLGAAGGCFGILCKQALQARLETRDFDPILPGEEP